VVVILKGLEEKDENGVSKHIEPTPVKGVMWRTCVCVSLYVCSLCVCVYVVCVCVCNCVCVRVYVWFFF
jgi:hypothetical protein